MNSLSKPRAFLSYVRFNDNYDEGKISELCKRLSEEIRAQSGREFDIFQDKKDIRIGDVWRQSISQALDNSLFFIAIITPNFFNSKYCREELSYFIEKEASINQTGLILPIYYITCKSIEDETVRSSDNLANLISSRNIFDWRDLRFESFSDPKIRRKLASLASEIITKVDSLKSSN
jgi:hypothetical protein